MADDVEIFVHTCLLFCEGRRLFQRPGQCSIAFWWAINSSAGSLKRFVLTMCEQIVVGIKNDIVLFVLCSDDIFDIY